MKICPQCYAQEGDDARFCGLCGTPLPDITATHVAEDGGLVGQLINNKYTVEKHIGHGGMGDVYMAVDRVLDRQVAIKILNQRFRTDETIIVRFYNEAKSYARVNHPNAVTLYDYGQLGDGTVYLIMEYVPGENLTDAMRRTGPMDRRQVLNLGQQLAEALLAAHEQGVIHRDLKPDNIMLVTSTKGRMQLKVLDFGIAKLVDDTGSQLTQTGMVFGTPEFMSPEQAKGIAVDQRADIYAFGLILYYMMTQRLPFEGRNKFVILQQQVHDTPPPPSQRCPDLEIDTQLEALVMQCLTKNRDERYPSFENVLNDLETLREGGTLPWFDPDAWAARATQTQLSPEELEALAAEAHGPSEPTFSDTTQYGTQPQSSTPTPALAASTPATPTAEERVTKPQQAADDGFSFGDLDGFALSDEPQHGLAEKRDELIIGDDSNDLLGGSWRDDDDDDYQPRPRRGGSTGLIIFLLLVIGGSIGGYVYMTQKNTTDTSPQTSDPKLSKAQANDPKTDGNTTDSKPIKPPPPPTPKVTPPPESVSADVRQRALALLVIERAEAGLQTPDLKSKKTPFKKSVDALLTLPEANVKNLPERLTKSADALREKSKQATAAWAQGITDNRKMRCAKVKLAADTLTPLSKPAGEAMLKKHQTCQHRFNSAPSKLPD